MMNISSINIEGQILEAHKHGELQKKWIVMVRACEL